MKAKWTMVFLFLAAGMLFVPVAHAVDGAAFAATEVASTTVSSTTAVVGDDAAAACCYNPCIIYKARGRCRRSCCGCAPPVQTTLTVADPCCCKCAVDIPVCVPACCKGAPSCVTSRCGMLCKGVVTYKWCCGYTVKVVFKKCGDVVVISKRC
ncbi:MAG: hypothetical protein N2C12_18285 [Planctomycetales bacterium]